MEKDCGLWINVLSHKLKKRMNANMQSLGITGVQSRVMPVSYTHLKTKGPPVPLAVPTTRQWDHIQNSARKNTGK